MHLRSIRTAQHYMQITMSLKLFVWPDLSCNTCYACITTVTLTGVIFSFACIMRTDTDIDRYSNREFGSAQLQLPMHITCAIAKAISKFQSSPKVSFFQDRG